MGQVHFLGGSGDAYLLAALPASDRATEGYARLDPPAALAALDDALQDPARRRWIAEGLALPPASMREVLAEALGGPAELARFGLWHQPLDRPALDIPDLADAPMLSELQDEPPPPAAEAPDLRFEVRVIDELGEPVAGVELRWTHVGESDTVTTDGDGRARFERPPGPSAASVRLADLDGLRDALRPRWDATGRSPGAEVIEPSDDVSVAFLREDLGDKSFGIFAGTPHEISIQPYVMLARLFGLTFETSKSFLMPDAIPSVRAMRRLYDGNPQTTLLLVGHTDTVGEPSYNDPLSLERAESMAAFLTDDVEAWFAWYGTGKPAEKRWGSREDGLMMASFLGERDDASVGVFQREYNLAVEAGQVPGPTIDEDGAIGPQTRRALIRAYMAHDDTTLPEGVEPQVHGCGENFPLGEDGEQLDDAPAQAQEDRTDRRAELLFFDQAMGVQPPPPGANSGAGSPQYPEWRARARVVEEYRAGVQVPIFDWDEALDPGVPRDLTLTLHEGELQMTIAWSAGARSGRRRRFVFGELTGDEPCTLVASTGGQEHV
ncbi:MAG: hypothetical protein KDK70_27945, partial [Myxococcales bacterium]|nr:hypothetical protein [Myxococcales bacterium]